MFASRSVTTIAWLSMAVALTSTTPVRMSHADASNKAVAEVSYRDAWMLIEPGKFAEAATSKPAERRQLPDTGSRVEPSFSPAQPDDAAAQQPYL